MNLNRINTNYKKKFLKDGYVHLKSILSKKDLKKILNKSVIFKRKNELVSSKYLHIHKKVPEIMSIFRNKKIKNLIINILEFKKIYGLQSELFFNPAGTPGYGAHQDDFFLGTGRNNSSNLWIPLVKTNKKNGTLFFHLRSHNLPIKRKINIKNLHGNEKNKNLIKYKKINCNCSLGDAILISNHIFHGSNKNKSKKNRYVLALGYINNLKKFKSGKTAKRKPFSI